MSSLTRIPWQVARSDIATAKENCVRYHVHAQHVRSRIRIELLNHYPEVVAGKAEIESRECTWEVGSRRLTLWYHHVDGEWRVLDSLYHDANLAF